MNLANIENIDCNWIRRELFSLYIAVSISFRLVDVCLCCGPSARSQHKRLGDGSMSITEVLFAARGAFIIDEAGGNCAENVYGVQKQNGGWASLTHTQCCFVQAYFSHRFVYSLALCGLCYFIRKGGATLIVERCSALHATRLWSLLGIDPSFKHNYPHLTNPSLALITLLYILQNITTGNFPEFRRFVCLDPVDCFS